MSSDAPFFSVVIPCYKAAATLPATMNSVLQQSCSDFEVVLVIDGCPAGSLEVANRLAATDTRIKVIYKENGGVSSARNLGISAANGSIIAFLDADDLWMPEKLARHKGLFESNPTISVSFAQIQFLMPDGSPTSVVSNRPIDGFGITMLLAENIACTTSNLLARAEVFDRIGAFDETLHFDEDKEWIFRAHARGEQFLGLNEVLTGYRTSPDGLASDLDQMERDWLRYVEIVRTYEPDAVATTFPKARALFLRNLSRRALRLGCPGGAALRLIARAVFSNPLAICMEPRRWALTGLAALVVATLPSRTAGWLMTKLESVPSKPFQA